MFSLEKDIGSLMQLYRKNSLGFNQSEFGDLIEKEQSDVSDIERGNKLPSVADLQILYRETKRPVYRILAKGLAVDNLNLNF